MQKAEAEEARRRNEAEICALELRASMLAPQFRSLEEGRATLQGREREGVRITGLFIASVPPIYDDARIWHLPRQASVIIDERNPPQQHRSYEKASNHGSGYY